MIWLKLNTLEISACKYPSTSQLSQIWSDNQKALIDYLKLANTGVRGIVMFVNVQVAQNLTVKIDSREPYFKTTSYGELYRILLAGSYQLTLTLNCDTVLYSSNITVPPSTA